MGIVARKSSGEPTPENLRSDGTARIPPRDPPDGGILDRIAAKAADPDRDESTQFFGINMGAVGQVLNKMLFGPPTEVQALRRPTTTRPNDATRIIQTAANLFDRRAGVLRPELRGHAYDVALVAALEFSFRDIHPQLATLKPAEVDRLAQVIIGRAIASRRMRDTSPQARALALFAVRNEVELARSRAAARTTPPPAAAAPTASTAHPAPPAALVAPSSTPAATPAAMARPDFISTTIASITKLAPAANATLQQREASAIQVQRIVDATTRALIAQRPTSIALWLQALRRANATASFLPVSYNDGWSVLVKDGRAVGTIDATASISPAVNGQRYRFRLRDMNDTRRVLAPQAVDLNYEFGENTRFINAADYAATLVAQNKWTTAKDWPSGKSPWDLAVVASYFQQMLDKNVPMSQVYARWQEYLETFYQHATSLSIQGPGNLLDMAPGSTERFEHDAQGLANDMLAARTGERLVDCEFFSAITHDVFGRLKDSRGQPRFETKWVTMDVHTTALVVERGTGRRSWAYVNNDRVLANGTTSTAGFDPAIAERIARVTRWGNPSVFGISDTYAGATAATTDTFYGPRTRAYYFDGAGNLSRVSELDNRAYWIFATTRAKRLTEHADHADFVQRWNGLRDQLNTQH